MNRYRALLLGGALAAGALSACGTSGESAKSTTTAKPDVTTTVEATTTSEEPTTEATTTTEASPFPDYATYLADLPAGTATCDTKGIVTGSDGQYGLGGDDAVLAMVDGQMTIFCPGAQLTVGTPFTGVNQFGDPLVEGDTFSVAPDGSYVQVSGF